MKVKLLKKVRKRFEIIHQPQGFVYYGDHYNYNLFKLVDHDRGGFGYRYAQLGRKKTGEQYCNDIFDTEKECIDFLKSKIIRRLRKEGHKQRKDNVIRKAQKKVWYI